MKIVDGIFFNPKVAVREKCFFFKIKTKIKFILLKNYLINAFDEVNFLFRDLIERTATEVRAVNPTRPPTIM